MIEVGDRVVIVDSPVSTTVKGHGGREATVLAIIASDVVEIQIVGMDRIGRRRIFVTDLEPAGQLRLL